MDLREEKVRKDIVFYFWTGICLYAANNILNFIDFHQRYGFDPIGYMGFLFYFGINAALLICIKRLYPLARTLFILKFIVFALMFYPQTFVLKSGSWMYSHHFPHGVLQRISNFGNFAYELFFVWYLLKRSVKYAFTHR